MNDNGSVRHHLLIAGTGRAGTSLLVKILAACGLDTEVNRANGPLWHEPANAGAESLPLPNSDQPYVLKSPWAYQFLDELLYRRDVRIDGLIVPIRDLREATASRIIVELQNMYRVSPAHDQFLTTWHDWGMTPGGVTYSLEPIDQARILGQSLHLILEKALEKEIPICLVKFPKFVRDPIYLYNSLARYISDKVDVTTFEKIFHRIVLPEQIRVSSELAEAASARAQVSREEEHLPRLEALENIALKRELRSNRRESERASTEIGSLTARCTELEAELAISKKREPTSRGERAAVEVRTAESVINFAHDGRIQDKTCFASLRTFSTIFLNHSGYSSDKWSQFLTVYDSELEAMITRNRPLRLLEIGVQNGGSLQIWREYLPEGSQIYGIDIDERCRQLPFPPEIKVLIGDAGDPAVLDDILGNEIFDIIIDDGCHHSDYVVCAFQSLFPRLAPGGKYFIEDLHVSYSPSYAGGFRKPGTSIEYLKGIVDALHTDYFQPSETIRGAERDWLIDLNSQISRISFYDSLAVLVKYPQPKLGRHTRVLSGKERTVSGADYLIDDIATNPYGFTFLGGQPDDVVRAAAKRISTLNQELHQLRTDIEQRIATEAAMRAEIEQRASTEAALRAEIERYAATEVALRAKIEQRVATEAVLRADIERRIATEAALRAEIERRALSEAGLRTEIEQYAATEATLRTEIEQYAATEATLRTEIEQYAASEAALRAKIEDGVLAQTALRHSLAQAEHAQQERATAAKHLEAELEIARNALTEAGHQRREAETAISGLQHQVSSLRQELSICREVGSAAISSLRAEAIAIPSNQQQIGRPLTTMLRSLGSRWSVHGR